MTRPKLKQSLRRILRPRLLVGHRLRPLSDSWGIERGTPVDRAYIESFLGQNAADIRGTVLEVGDARYARRFGRGIEKIDVLDVMSANLNATIIGDLASSDGLPRNAFDCFLLVQTLQYVPDTIAALRNARHVLRPGGVLLVTVPGIQSLDRHRVDADIWRFTPRSLGLLLADSWSRDDVQICEYGNALAATSFLYGVAREELSARQLGAHDRRFPVIVAARAVKNA
jgi:SAM-dependent methyltransferase